MPAKKVCPKCKLLKRDLMLTLDKLRGYLIDLEEGGLTAQQAPHLMKCYKLLGTLEGEDNE